MSSRIDVGQLALSREDDSRQAPHARRRWVSRYVLPAVLLLAFLSVVGWAARDVLVPAHGVTVMPVIARQTSVRQSGQPLFSAAGWVEARPTPVLVTALAGGVIRELLVVEGQAVAAGEPVAYLIDDDARLALRRAEAELRVREAELESARATLAAARTRLEQPVHLEAALAEAESRLAETEAALAALPHQVVAAEARVDLAEQNLQRKITAGNAVPARELDLARSERDSAKAELSQLQARRSHLETERAALVRRRTALETELELKTEETRQHREAEARLKATEAHIEQAQVAVDECRLKLERMTVRCPVPGRVLQLVATRGSPVSPGSDTSGHDAGTVVTLYDPAMLQVRADVRLEDVAQVTSGQPVRIETAAVGSPLAGRVLHATSRADIQKNTLEVKVAVDDPPPVLKPEMLVQVTFLAPEQTEQEKPPGERMRVYVPGELIDRHDDASYLWIADLTRGVARRQAVQTEGKGELVEVVEGLNVASRLIVGGREGLRDGQRIRVVGEDASLGTNRSAG